MDPNLRFQRAGQAFQAGRLDAARADLKALLVQLPNAAQAWHMLALAERKLDNAPAARAAFDRAIKLAPNDPALFSNYANLLGALGEHAAAIDRYRYAVKLKPDFADAWLNLGLTAQAAGDLKTASDALARANRAAPNDPRGFRALGLLLREAALRDEAATVLDAGLKLAPNDARMAEVRARVEAERGGPRAPELLARARERNPSDRSLVLAEAEARLSAGDDGWRDVLGRALAADPVWAEGHVALAKFAVETADPAPFAAFDKALALHPAERTLWEARVGLARRVEPESVAGLAAEARISAGANPTLDWLEADALLETDDPKAALALLENAAGPEAAIVRARLHLRLGDPLAASDAVGPLIDADPANQLAWALAATAWRALADPRAAWLLDRPGLWGRFDLDLDADALAGIAAHLRSLHTLQRAPADQSLRGGTQTHGTLFLRTAPEITTLRRAITSAIDGYLAALPPPITGHPLLSARRSNWRFTGSWSVRLSGGGFHVAHVHPQGWISSACYLALPEAMGDGHAGWLALGEPPAELRLELPPVALIEPRPGTLALFPSFLWHGTRPFAAGERLTAAFDVVPDSQ